MNEFVENVAKALCAADNGDPANWEHWAPSARAAIEAMGTTTMDMRIAAVQAGYAEAQRLLDAAQGTFNAAAIVIMGHGRIYEAAYQAAIEEALK
jgi:hypothetical protein